MAEEKIPEEYLNKDINRELLKNYVSSLKDEDFKKLVTKLNVNEKVAMKYTTKLENTVNELRNCKNCKGLENCKNKMCGCVCYPNVIGDRMKFDYIACKYKNAAIIKEKFQSTIFEEPASIRNARMADIDLTDKKRAAIIKWVKKFYTDYQKNPNIKGLYLHGSFGSGKSFIIASLLNELASKGAKTTIIYFPEMLRNLKSSFNSYNDEYNIKMESIKKSDILLIDDIGAESVTEWSRDEVLGTILQYRMDANLPTFLTSNLNIEELENHLSNTKGSIDIVKAKRIIERIKQLTDDLELVSENRRK